MNRRETTAVLLAAALMMAAAASLAGDSPAGKTVHAGGAGGDPALFESPSVVRRAEDTTEPLIVFDQSKSPSAYKTCYQETRKHKFLKILRPYDRAAFPPELAPPTIRWADTVNNLWMITLSAPGWAQPMRVITDRRRWRFDEATWRAVEAAGTGRENWANIEIRGCRIERGKRVGEEVHVDRARFRISEHKADPMIVYRLVSPLFHGNKTPNIYCRDISTYEQKMFLPSKGQYCSNCHSFPVKPTVPAEKVKVAIAIRKSFGEKTYRILGLYNFLGREGRTLNINSFFMSWHPDGNKVVVTGGNETAVRALITLETQEFYVKIADLRIIDYSTLSETPLRGASTAKYMETLPTWSPDGKTIMFARAEELGNTFVERKFDLYTVPYNNGDGGKAVPVPGASHNDMSNYAARYSTDGKWIVFNKADYSTLVAPSADLWILSTEEGALPRKLECNVPYAMDSHHSWSSNSRWLLFASKRDDGIFARLYLTEVDEGGHTSPPVALPCLDDPMMCYNVPEFLRYRLPIDAEDLFESTGSLK